MESNPDVLGPVIVGLSRRQASTVLVKVDAHKGHQGNERADRLAEMGRKLGEAGMSCQDSRSLRIGVRRGEEVESYRLGMVKKIARQGEEEASLVRLREKHAKKPTKMTKFLTMPGVGVARVGKAMNALSLAVASFQIKSIGGLVPTMRRLFVCGMAKKDTCPLPGCGGKEVETIEHMQSMCEALKGARMQAHNVIAERTTSAITDALRSIHPEWNPVHEHSAARVWEEITTDRLAEDTRGMKPDVVLMNKTLRRAHILEFNRPWDKDLQTLQERAEGKREHYAPLLADLQRKLPKGWSVMLHPMIVGVRGLTDEEQVMSTLKQMRLEEAQCERVYDVMVREALEQGLAMWKTRNVCLQGAADREKDGMRRSEGADGRGG